MFPALLLIIFRGPPHLICRLARARAKAAGTARIAETGAHPGPLPSPGVFARHNSVDTPALLPDGTVSELSVSRTLRERGSIAGSAELSGPTKKTVRALAGEDDGGGSGPGGTA